jgi:hypothetical protein
VAVFGAAGEAAEDRGAQAAGQADGGGGAVAGVADVAGEDAVHERGDGVAGEGALAEQGLVEGDAQGELVGARVGPLAAELFGGHEGGGADERAGDGEGGVEGAQVVAGVAGALEVGEQLGVAVGAGEAEVEDADAAVLADHAVLRLEVAVDQAGLVGGGEAGAGLPEDLEDLAPGSGLSLEPCPEGQAVDELHGDVDLVVVGADLVDADDVGVGEAGHGLGLADQAGAGVLVGAVGVEQLDGDFALELLVVGGVDDPGAAAAELADDGEAADAGGLAGFAEQAGHDVLLDAVVGEVALDAGPQGLGGDGDCGAGRGIGVEVHLPPRADRSLLRKASISAIQLASVLAWRAAANSRTLTAMRRASSTRPSSA